MKKHNENAKLQIPDEIWEKGLGDIMDWLRKQKNSPRISPILNKDEAMLRKYLVNQGHYDSNKIKEQPDIFKAEIGQINQPESFVVENAQHRPKNAIGVAIGKMVLFGRHSVANKKYNDNLKQVSINGLNAQKVNITVDDKQKIDALYITNPDGDKSRKTIVFFQGQRGNFKNSINNLQNMARDTGANIVAFNYRKNPDSTADLINDGRAVVEYLNSKGVKPDMFYGESLGGSVATCLLADMPENDRNNITLFASRSPKNIFVALKNMNLDQFLDKIPRLFRGISKIIVDKIKKSGLEKTLEDRNWLMPADQAIKQITPEQRHGIRVEGDPIVAKEAYLGTNIQGYFHVIKSYHPPANRHNLSLVQLRAVKNLQSALNNKPNQEIMEKSEGNLTLQSWADKKPNTEKLKEFEVEIKHVDELKEKDLDQETENPRNRSGSLSK